MFGATAWGEIHGIGKQPREVYDGFTRAVRAIAWDRIPRDALELLTLEFVRYSARILGGSYASEAGTLDGSLFPGIRVSDLEDFEADGVIETRLKEDRERNLKSATAFRNAQGEKLADRIELYRQTVTTSGGAQILDRLGGLPPEQRICPFIITLRRGWADLDTQAKAADMLLLRDLLHNTQDLLDLREEPWNYPATKFLKRHASRFDGDFWKGIELVNDEVYLRRHRTMNFVLYYLAANGFAREEGSFWFDIQHSVYALDVGLFITTDKRFSEALSSDYVLTCIRALGRKVNVVYIPPGKLMATRIADSVRQLS